MRIAPVALGIALTAACTPSGIHVQEAEIARGVPVLDVLVNGEAARCVVDTGDPNFAVSDRFGGAPWIGIGDPQPVELVMSVAGWTFTGAAITLADARFTAWEQDLGVDGIDCILGAGFLIGLRLTVDYEGGRVELLDEHGPVVRPATVVRGEHEDELLYEEWALVGTATVADELTGVFLYDSGASRVVLTEEALADLSEPPDLDGNGRGVLSAVEVAGSRLEGVPFEVGDDAWLHQVGATLGLRVDGVIGASFLAGHAVTWDWVEGRLVLRPYEEDVQRDALSALYGEL